MDETAAQTPQLVPVDAAPTHYGRGHSHGYPSPPVLPQVRALAARLGSLLAAAPVSDPPGRFRVADIAAALGVPATNPLLPAALVFAGHGPVVVDPGHGLLVTLRSAAGVAELDAVVLRAAGAAVAAVGAVSAREVYRRAALAPRAGCGAPALSRWLAWGALTRLEAAGRLVRDPGCRWPVTTRWQLAPDSISV